MNRICQGCLGKCKQDERVEVLQCKNFKAKPKQLEFKFPLKQTKKRK